MTIEQALWIADARNVDIWRRWPDSTPDAARETALTMLSAAFQVARQERADAQVALCAERAARPAQLREAWAVGWEAYQRWITEAPNHPPSKETMALRDYPDLPETGGQ